MIKVAPAHQQSEKQITIRMGCWKETDYGTPIIWMPEELMKGRVNCAIVEHKNGFKEIVSFGDGIVSDGRTGFNIKIDGPEDDQS